MEKEVESAYIFTMKMTEWYIQRITIRMIHYMEKVGYIDQTALFIK